MSVVNVQVVRPKLGVPELIGRTLGVVVGYFISGALVSWAAARVGVVPDLGYLESVALVIGASYLLHQPGNYFWWTKAPA